MTSAFDKIGGRVRRCARLPDGGARRFRGARNPGAGSRRRRDPKQDRTVATDLRSKHRYSAGNAQELGAEPQARGGTGARAARADRQTAFDCPGRVEPLETVGPFGIDPRIPSPIHRDRRGRRHPRARTVQCTQLGSTRNSGSAWPAARRSRRAAGMPNPYRCTRPSTRIASARIGFR